jgi:peptidoglycan/xylan/chitin deacetylase (PgdA/CDA1 family)
MRTVLLAAAAAGVVALGACSGTEVPGAGTPSPLPAASAGTSSSTSPATSGTSRAVPPSSTVSSGTVPTGTRPASTRPASAGPTTSKPPRARPTSAPTSKPRPTPAPSCTIPAALRGKDIATLPTTRKVVALTFDAGASNDGVASILAVLRQQGVPATFFLTGDFVDAFPSSARAMAAQGPVGNHTYNHPDLTTLSDAAVRNEIRTAAVRIQAVTGQNPRPLFRFPFGAVDNHVIALVNADCYVPFRWTVDTLGWKGTSEGQSVSTVVARVLGAARPGEIVLMHVGAHPKDGSTLDADALPQVISGLRSRGYGFVTLESAFG